METAKRILKEVIIGLLMVLFSIIFCNFWQEICGIMMLVFAICIFGGLIFFDKLPSKLQKHISERIKVSFDYIEKLWNFFLETIFPNLLLGICWILCFITAYIVFHETGLMFLPLGAGAVMVILASANQD